MLTNRIYHFLIIFSVFSCRSVQGPKENAQQQTNKYQCVLAEADFDESTLNTGEVYQSASRYFTTTIDYGIFYFSEAYNTSNSNKAIIIDLKRNLLICYDKDGVQERNPDQKDTLVLRRLVETIELGSFRQACYNAPSEGSASILIVRNYKQGITKYESSQLSFNNLAETEQRKLPRMMALLKLVETYAK